jgi:hypothetical protein
MLASYHKYTDTKIISRPGRFVKGFAKSRTDALDVTQPAVALPSKNTLLYLPRILVIIDADPDLKTTSEVTTMTKQQVIELITLFYCDPAGVYEEELDEFPVAKEFVDNGFAEPDEEEDDFYVITVAGDEALYPHI